MSVSVCENMRAKNKGIDDIITEKGRENLCFIISFNEPAGYLLIKTLREN